MTGGAPVRRGRRGSSACARALPAGSALLAGERQGVQIDGFDLGNSPGECTPAVCQGKTMVITTTNGTRALLACVDAELVIVGSFVNFAATSQRLLHESKPIHLVCAGTEGRSAMRIRSWPGPSPTISEKWTFRWATTKPRSLRGSGRGSRIIWFKSGKDDAGRANQPAGALPESGTWRAACGTVGAE